jgi:hypothetical protein
MKGTMKNQSKEYKFKFAENHLDGYNQGHKKWKSPYSVHLKEGINIIGAIDQYVKDNKHLEDEAYNIRQLIRIRGKLLHKQKLDSKDISILDDSGIVYQ